MNAKRMRTIRLRYRCLLYPELKQFEDVYKADAAWGMAFKKIRSNPIAINRLLIGLLIMCPIIFLVIRKVPMSSLIFTPAVFVFTYTFVTFLMRDIVKIHLQDIIKEYQNTQEEDSPKSNDRKQYPECGRPVANDQD